MLYINIRYSICKIIWVCMGHPMPLEHWKVTTFAAAVALQKWDCAKKLAVHPSFGLSFSLDWKLLFVDAWNPVIARCVLYRSLLSLDMLPKNSTRSFHIQSTVVSCPSSVLVLRSDVAWVLHGFLHVDWEHGRATRPGMGEGIVWNMQIFLSQAWAIFQGLFCNAAHFSD